VAAGRVPLRAEEREPRGGCAGDELVDRGEEAFLLHVGGVAPERGRQSPGRRSFAVLAPPAERFAPPCVVDSPARERGPERPAVELRVHARARKPPDVDEDVDRSAPE
jgi:hypothetical protein